MSARRTRCLRLAWFALPVLGLTGLLATGSVGAADFSGSAFVRDDGTLRVRNRTVRLYGVHIPKTGRTCRRYERPPTCGSRAALALDFKIQGFVHCWQYGRDPDGSIRAQCWVGTNEFRQGDDLSAYLLERGWAVALPDAPIEYQALESIARKRGLGLWGFAVEPRNR